MKILKMHKKLACKVISKSIVVSRCIRVWKANTNWGFQEQHIGFWMIAHKEFEYKFSQVSTQIGHNGGIWFYIEVLNGAFKEKDASSYNISYKLVACYFYCANWYACLYIARHLTCIPWIRIKFNSTSISILDKWANLLWCSISHRRTAGTWNILFSVTLNENKNKFTRWSYVRRPTHEFKIRSVS